MKRRGIGYSPGRWLAWLRYRLNSSLAKGSKLPFLFLAIAAALLVLAGAQAQRIGLFSKSALEAEGIDARFGGGFFDSYFWSVKHVLDVGAFAEDYGAPPLVLLISLAVSVGGLVVTGTLIGLISASIQRRLTRLELGNSRAMERDHVVVLGWGPSVPELIENLLVTHSGRPIVVLAPRELSVMREELRRGGVDPWKELIILRRGVPSRRAELERVSIRNAVSVVVVTHSLEEGQPGGETDAEAIKTLLVLEGLLREAQSDRRQGSSTSKESGPSVVCEISSSENAEIVRIASRGRAASVSSADLASRLLVQAARQPGIVGVFERILTAAAGGIVVETAPDAVDVTFERLALSLEHAVPIGVSWVESRNGVERNAAALNPEPSYEIGDDERIVLLTDGDGFSLNLARETEVTDQEFEVAEGENDAPEPSLGRVLILGWNSLVDEILAELSGHTADQLEVTIVTERLPDEAVVRSLATRFPRLDIDLRRGDTANRSVLAGLIEERFDCLFTIAVDADGEDPDARTIMTLLLLGDLWTRAGRVEIPRVVVELRDGRNRELLKGSVATEVVVSEELVCVVMAQVAKQPILAPVYRELLSAGGIEIGLRPAAIYARIGEPVAHAEVVSRGQARFETVLGVRIQSGAEPKVRLVPSLRQTWRFDEDDSVIVLSQQVYR
jgi:hypothetical protein